MITVMDTRRTFNLAFQNAPLGYRLSRPPFPGGAFFVWRLYGGL